MIFFYFRHPVVLFGSPGDPNCHATLCIIMLSHRLYFFIVLNRDLFVNRGDSLTSKRVIMRTKQATKCVVPHQ